MRGWRRAWRKEPSTGADDPGGSGDSLGNRCSGADGLTLQCNSEALEQFHCFSGDPLHMLST
ncbi:MAG: hypothetical protein AB1Z21_01035, partial [Synechococcaceae cyanobacterium]